MSIVGWLLGAAIAGVGIALVYHVLIAPKRNAPRAGHSPASGQYPRIASGKSPRVTTGQVKRVATGQSRRVATNQTRRVTTGQTRQVKTGQTRAVRTGEVRVVSGEFHAVSVVPEPGCCEAVQKLAGQRFLSAEAPTLPLADCTAANCGCRYRHHADRRYHERRDVSLYDVELKGTYDGPERRSGQDRRKSG